MTSSAVTLDPRLVKLTTRSGIEVRRTLPHKLLRTIGAWCFVDHYGPTAELNAMKVANHPHTGLQTATWLFEGSVEHNDSVGSKQIINPGELNLMTAGRGISHSELSLGKGDSLSGVQLWIALPDAVRNMAPEFASHSNLPLFEYEGVQVRVFVGEFLGHKSEAKVFTPLVGVELLIPAGTSIQLPLSKEFEYGYMAGAGDLMVNGEVVSFGQLRYEPIGSDQVVIASPNGGRVILLGGEPFPEQLLMWWNFIGRTHEEIVDMRDDWQAQSSRFGHVHDSIGERIPAPEMPAVRLAPRGNRD